MREENQRLVPEKILFTLFLRKSLQLRSEVLIKNQSAVRIE